MKRALCILAMAGMATTAMAQSMTQNTSMVPTAGASVACAGGGLTTDNQYLRSFNFASFGISGTYNVQSVEISVEVANNPGGVPLTLRLYGQGLPNSYAGLGAPIASTNFTAANGNLYNMVVPIAALVNTGTTPNLTVEIVAPDLRGSGGQFFYGANSAGQSAPSYLASTTCGLPNPQTTDSVGFPNAHYIMRVNGVPAPASAAVLGLAGLAAARRRR